MIVSQPASHQSHVSQNSVFPCPAPSGTARGQCPPVMGMRPSAPGLHVPVSLLCPGVQLACELCHNRARVQLQRPVLLAIGDVPRQHRRSANRARAAWPYAFVGTSFLGVTGLLVCHRWL